MIKGRCNITDCEHMGDVRSAIADVEKLGCHVIDAYWDGHDCGEAYVLFEFSEERFVQVYEKMPYAFFDADINDYVKLPIMKEFQTKIVRSDELRKAYYALGGSDGAVLLYIKLNKFDVAGFITEARKYLGKPKMCSQRIDGSIREPYAQVLFKASAKKQEKFKITDKRVVRLI